VSTFFGLTCHRNEGLESVDLVPIRMPPNSLYGSELIRKSLEASSQNETAGMILCILL